MKSAMSFAGVENFWEICSKMTLFGLKYYISGRFLIVFFEFCSTGIETKPTISRYLSFN